MSSTPDVGYEREKTGRVDTIETPKTIDSELGTKLKNCHQHDSTKSTVINKVNAFSDFATKKKYRPIAAFLKLCSAKHLCFSEITTFWYEN